MSHLTRGAWIEMIVEAFVGSLLTGRTSHEVRGLKLLCSDFGSMITGRTSHEVRGLK